MKKKYFAPEMEEVEVEGIALLAGRVTCEDETKKENDDACADEVVDDM